MVPFCGTSFRSFPSLRCTCIQQPPRFQLQNRSENPNSRPHSESRHLHDSDRGPSPRPYDPSGGWTSLPGGLGNLVLAGHRDTFFRPLRNVKAGMQIEIASKIGNFRYSIDSTEIVMPDQVRVLDLGDRPGMTLITCYPFDYIGPAPERFNVHAHLLSADPS